MSDDTSMINVAIALECCGCCYCHCCCYFMDYYDDDAVVGWEQAVIAGLLMGLIACSAISF